MKKTIARGLLCIMLLQVFLLALGSSALAAQGSSTGNATINGEAVITSIDTLVYSVVLPTSESLDFSLDPQGLLTLEDGETAELSELEGGNIVHNGAAQAVNNSSVPIKLTAALTATGDASLAFIAKGADDAATLASVAGNVDEYKILMYAIPSSVNIATPTSTSYAASSRGYVLSKSATTLTFILDKADYFVVGGATPSFEFQTDTGNGTGIQIGGKINPYADWFTFDDANKTVGVDAVFSFAAADINERAYETETDIPGLVASPTSFNNTDYLTVSTTPTVAGFYDENDPTKKTVAKSLIPPSGEFSTNFFLDGNNISEMWDGSWRVPSNNYRVENNQLILGDVYTSEIKGNTGIATSIWISLDDGSSFNLVFSPS